MVQLTQAATQEIHRLQQVRQQSGLMLRITVQPGGCSGLIYSLELTEYANHSEQAIAADGIKIVASASTLRYLKGLVLDYTEDLMGGGFRFYNPRLAGVCSCGLSFTELSPEFR